MDHIENDYILKDRNLFIIDCETDGLYGPFLTVSILIADPGLQILESYYYGASEEIERAKDPWVKENVLPILEEYTDVKNEDGLLDAGWDLWMKYRENSYALADVAYPVEGRYFYRCVMKDYPSRKNLAPFPLLDLSSLLYEEKKEPLADRLMLCGDYNAAQHNASADTEMTRIILRKLREGTL